MATKEYVFSGSVSVAEAIEAFSGLGSVVAGLNVAGCRPDQLQDLTAGIRRGQRTLELLLVKVGVAADIHESQGEGRGAQATMLGDGSHVRGSTARQETARARTASSMRKVGEAVDEGRIGTEQIDAIARAVKDLSPEQQAQMDTDDLIDAAASLPADTFARKVRDEADRVRGDHGLADTKAKQARSSWKHWTDRRTGMGRISAEFDPERHEAIAQAVEALVSRLANEGGVSKDSNLAANAAFQLITGKAERRGGLPHINIVVDLETLRGGPHPDSVRETAAGRPLPPESISRLACDAVLQRVVMDAHGVPVNVGRKHRTATDGQWHALRAMHRTCAWKDCDRPLSWCQAHHIHEWEHQGVTDLCNLIPLCNRHHHAVHEGGWSVKLDPVTRRLDIIDPDRRHFGTAYPDRCGERGGPRSRRSEPVERGAP